MFLDACDDSFRNAAGLEKKYYPGVFCMPVSTIPDTCFFDKQQKIKKSLYDLRSFNVWCPVLQFLINCFTLFLIKISIVYGPA